MSRKRTILIVPARGTSGKVLRVRLSVLVIFALVIAAGFIGYFIPFDNMSQSVAERNQKQNLKEQNKKLFQNIVSTLKILNSLREQVTKLESKMESVNELGGLPIDVGSNYKAGKIQLDPGKMKPDALLLYLSEREDFISKFADLASDKNSLFDHAPVSKPIGERAVTTRRYGLAKDPFTGKQKTHYGLDLAASTGTSVVAAAHGTVSIVEHDPIWGRRIVINHQDGYRTVYAHLGTASVSRGKLVRRGEVIGTIGISGLTTGPHLHYEVWRNNKPVDPEDYIFPEIDGLDLENNASVLQFKNNTD